MSATDREDTVIVVLMALKISPVVLSVFDYDLCVGMQARQRACGGQRTTLGNPFSPSTKWVLDIELSLAGLHWPRKMGFVLVG